MHQKIGILKICLMIIETRTFADFTVDEWVKMIKDIFDEGLEVYERHNDVENKGIVLKLK